MVAACSKAPDNLTYEPVTPPEFSLADFSAISRDGITIGLNGVWFCLREAASELSQSDFGALEITCNGKPIDYSLIFAEANIEQHPHDVAPYTLVHALFEESLLEQGNYRMQGNYKGVDFDAWALVEAEDMPMLPANADDLFRVGFSYYGELEAIAGLFFGFEQQQGTFDLSDLTDLALERTSPDGTFSFFKQKKPVQISFENENAARGIWYEQSDDQPKLVTTFHLAFKDHILEPGNYTLRGTYRQRSFYSTFTLGAETEYI